MGKISVLRDHADVDPLTLLCAPPRDETPEARATRERAEADAKRTSDAIDEQLRQERTSRAKRRAPVKVLLLGQSESGAWQCSPDPCVALTSDDDHRQVDRREKCVPCAVSPLPRC
jgi:hypothetical protein